MSPEKAFPIIRDILDELCSTVFDTDRRSGFVSETGRTYALDVCGSGSGSDSVRGLVEVEEYSQFGNDWSFALFNFEEVSSPIHVYLRSLTCKGRYHRMEVRMERGGAASKGY